MRGSVRQMLYVSVIWGILVGSTAGEPAGQPGEYLGPLDVAAARDGRSLLVLNADARQVAVMDAAGKVIRSIPMPARPTGLALSPDGATLYVTCAAPEGTVCVVDVGSGKVRATIPAGHTPTAPTLSPDGKRLYVSNRFDNDVSVIDLEAGKQLARVPAIREPIASAVTPDGKLLLVANHLPADRANQHGVDAVAAAVTLVATDTGRPSTMRLTTGSSSLRGICVSPDGRYAFVVHLLSRYHLPTIQVERGWMNANAMSVIDVPAKKLINTVLLDELTRGAANPWDVAVTADGRWICISHAGTHELTVIDAVGLLAKLRAMPLAGHSNAFIFGEPFYYGISRTYVGADVANDPTFLDGLRRRIKLEGKGPRGLTVIGSKVYVAEYFSDSLAVVDLRAEPEKAARSLALGPGPVLTPQRQGQMHFGDATLCFQQWQSCSSCHPDARADALNWDLLNDGTGNPKNTKSLLLAHRTPPVMASGIRPSAEDAVRSGIMHIQFADCPEPVAEAIDAYLKTLRPVPGPRLVDGRLSQAARRGKKLFFSPQVNCAKCHPPPWYTDLRTYDVGSRGPSDRRAEFDTPTLIEVWRTAPYLHDGRCTTIRELIVEGRHGAGWGAVDELEPQQVDDLVEFVLSL